MDPDSRWLTLLFYSNLAISLKARKRPLGAQGGWGNGGHGGQVGGREESAGKPVSPVDVPAMRAP